MEEILLFLRRLKNDTINKIDGLGTSFETWKTDWTAERAEKLDNLDNLDVPVSTRSTQTSVDALTLDLATSAGKLDTLLGRGITKRVIRGYVAWTHKGWSERTLDSSRYQVVTQVTIPAVDMSKSIVFVNMVGGGTSSAGGVAAFLTDTTTLEIRLGGRPSDSREVNYQIIEFY